MHCRTSCLLLGLALLPVRFAWAESASAKERAARTSCLSGDYTKGVAILSELFVDTKDPTHIYNQGRCFEQNRRYEDAIARFQEYLRAGKKLSKTDKTDAQQHIADCKDLLASQSSPQPGPAATPSQTAQAATATPVAPAPVPPGSAMQPDIAQQTRVRGANESGSAMRTAGIIAAGVGGAGLVAGLFLNLKVNSMADDLQKTDNYSASKASDRKRYETLGWVSYGIGAACVATGVVLYILGSRSTTAGAAVAFVPAFAPGQAGAVLKGSF